MTSVETEFYGVRVRASGEAEIDSISLPLAVESLHLSLGEGPLEPILCEFFPGPFLKRGKSWGTSEIQAPEGYEICRLITAGDSYLIALLPHVNDSLLDPFVGVLVEEDGSILSGGETLCEYFVNLVRQILKDNEEAFGEPETVQIDALKGGKRFRPEALAVVEAGIKTS